MVGTNRKDTHFDFKTQITLLSCLNVNEQKPIFQNQLNKYMKQLHQTSTYHEQILTKSTIQGFSIEYCNIFLDRNISNENIAKNLVKNKSIAIISIWRLLKKSRKKLFFIKYQHKSVASLEISQRGGVISQRGDMAKNKGANMAKYQEGGALLCC